MRQITDNNATTNQPTTTTTEEKTRKNPIKYHVKEFIQNHFKKSIEKVLQTYPNIRFSQMLSVNNV